MSKSKPNCTDSVKALTDIKTSDNLKLTITIKDNSGSAYSNTEIQLTTEPVATGGGGGTTTPTEAHELNGKCRIISITPKGEQAVVGVNKNIRKTLGKKVEYTNVLDVLAQTAIICCGDKHGDEKYFKVTFSDDSKEYELTQFSVEGKQIQAMVFQQDNVIALSYLDHEKYEFIFY